MRHDLTDFVASMGRYMWDTLRTEWALAVLWTCAAAYGYAKTFDADTLAGVLLHGLLCALALVCAAGALRSAVHTEITRHRED